MCGKVISLSDLLCRECRKSLKGPNPIPQHGRGYTLHYFGEYSGTLKKIILSYKGGRWRLKNVLADLYLKMWNYFQPDVESLVYIPSGYESLEERGFDHMELVAKELSKRVGIPYNRVLENVSSVKQTGLKRSERLENTGRFRCFGYPGSSVLLLDDIYTTGSTVNDAVKALRSCGTVNVQVFVLAKV